MKNIKVPANTPVTLAKFNPNSDQVLTFAAHVTQADHLFSEQVQTENTPEDYYGLDFCGDTPLDNYCNTNGLIAFYLHTPVNGFNYLLVNKLLVLFAVESHPIFDQIF